ncbi:MAG TPA: RNA repair domain-containing protein [Candidatus Nanoarchaeia archaeon]|nr:RNA repair domain-containing protein [Candidatus Nanoarchaeia archaeon]
MFLREQDKHFLASLYVAIAVIFTWKGIWEGVYEIPYLGDPFVFLFIGFAILTFSGLIFKEFDPLGNIQKAVEKTIQEVHNHPERDKFMLKYHDQHHKKDILIPAKMIHKIEKGTVIINQGKKQETFIPLHRIIEITYQGKKYWRL